MPATAQRKVEGHVRSYSLPATAQRKVEGYVRSFRLPATVPRKMGSRERSSRLQTAPQQLGSSARTLPWRRPMVP